MISVMFIWVVPLSVRVGPVSSLISKSKSTSSSPSIEVSVTFLTILRNAVLSLVNEHIASSADPIAKSVVSPSGLLKAPCDPSVDSYMLHSESDNFHPVGGPNSVTL